MEKKVALHPAFKALKVCEDGRIYHTLRKALVPVQSDRFGTKRIKIAGRHYRVAALVLEAFGFLPNGRTRIVYRDGNKANVTLSNLSWSDTHTLPIDDEAFLDPSLNWRIHPSINHIQVSACGKVFSYLNRSGDLLKQRKSDDGYLFVQAGGEMREVGRLVLEAHTHINNPMGVLYLNGDKEDVRLENLMWAEPADDSPLRFFSRKQEEEFDLSVQLATLSRCVEGISERLEAMEEKIARFGRVIKPLEPMEVTAGFPALTIQDRINRHTDKLFLHQNALSILEKQHLPEIMDRLVTIERRLGQ